MKLESPIVYVFVLFKFCEIALKSLNKMSKLLISCFKISDL